MGRVGGSDALDWGVNGLRQSLGLASSSHPAGANIGLGDGSTHFLSDNLSVDTLSDLASMADGRVVSEF